jgi:hypothetical protein
LGLAEVSNSLSAGAFYSPRPLAIFSGDPFGDMVKKE